MFNIHQKQLTETTNNETIDNLCEASNLAQTTDSQENELSNALENRTIEADKENTTVVSDKSNYLLFGPVESMRSMLKYFFE